jgi:hypothetical protein
MSTANGNGNGNGLVLVSPSEYARLIELGVNLSLAGETVLMDIAKAKWNDATAAQRLRRVLDVHEELTFISEALQWKK